VEQLSKEDVAMSITVGEDSALPYTDADQVSMNPRWSVAVKAESLLLITGTLLVLVGCHPATSSPSAEADPQIAQVGRPSARVETPVKDRITLYLGL
jgi:hypothetical protein